MNTQRCCGWSDIGNLFVKLFASGTELLQFNVSFSEGNDLLSEVRNRLYVACRIAPRFEFIYVVAHFLRETVDHANQVLLRTS